MEQVVGMIIGKLAGLLGMITRICMPEWFLVFSAAAVMLMLRVTTRIIIILQLMAIFNGIIKISND